jgi:hypothetical protein
MHDFAVAWLVGRDVAAARVSARTDQERQWTLRKGDRIELVLPRLGILTRGTVYYVDDLQILVKWDDGRSENLRPSFADRFRIIERRANDADEGREPGRQRGEALVDRAPLSAERLEYQRRLVRPC